MKKVQRTEIPLPGVSAKAKSKATANPNSKPAQAAKPSQLSAEFVGSSDESAVEDTPKPKKSKQKPTTTIAIHKPQANGVSKKAQKPAPKPAPAVAKKPAAEESSSSNSEESDEDTKSVDYAQREHGEENKDKASEGGSSSSSDSSSSDSSDSDSEEAARDTQPEKRKPSTAHTVNLAPPQPFVPPKGFKAVTTFPDKSSPAIKLFGNLKGKQIWHITAPAGVPLSKLKDVSLEKAMNGDAVLSHADIDYGFTAEEKDPRATGAVLVPGGSGYKAASLPVSRTLHLQQVVRLPNITSKQADQNTGSEAAASITRSTIRAPRAQIRGLRMRYFPSGFGDADPGTLGDSESESERPAPATGGLSVPAPERIRPSQKSEKRKHDQINGGENLESPVKKHKKHKTPEEIKRKEEKKAKKERRREKEAAKKK